MFTLDPDKPTIPAIARILSGLGMLCLVASVGAILLTVSRFAWVNHTYAVAGALVAFLFGVVMIGQARTLELLAVVSARVKSRFAIEHALIPAASAAPPAVERKPLAPAAPTKDRVITIPEEVARQQGLTRRRELD